jgi:hypothetical protein
MFGWCNIANLSKYVPFIGCIASVFCLFNCNFVKKRPQTRDFKRATLTKEGTAIETTNAFSQSCRRTDNDVIKHNKDIRKQLGITSNTVRKRSRKIGGGFRKNAV